jgi:uncharacterized protein (DUF1810 family)
MSQEVCQGNTKKIYPGVQARGLRLQECSRIVAALDGRAIEDIFGQPDTMKFQSSMTLFAHVAADNKVFNKCLRKYFGGGPDPFTLAHL